MGLVLHTRDEPGYRELDFDALSNEQALEVANLVHDAVLPFLSLKDSLAFSLRLDNALKWIEPPLKTFEDVKRKPLESWRKHPFMTPRIYHELREAVRPYRVFLPAWEMLP